MTVELLKKEEELTRADRKILEFIGSNTEEFLFLGIGQLAERLEVSEATISRFARHAGYRDFKHLKQSVMQQSREKGPARKIARTLQKEDSFQITKWMEYQKECLERTIEEMDPELFESAARKSPGRTEFLFFEKRVGRNGRTFVFPAAQNRDSG